MKTSFANFWKRNLACAKLAIQSQLEYRFNFFADAIIQPALTGIIEVALWGAIISSLGTRASLGGFPREYYLAYALWAAFFARIGSNWMYEFKMATEIESGTVNSVLTRPISFYEYYLSQFMGYKIMTSVTSMCVPIAITFFLPGPTQLDRLPLAFALQLVYLVFVHTLSFSVASIAFFLNRSHAFTMVKNIALTVLTGELFPLDLVPAPFRGFMMSLPFANAVYIPVGYLTGRLEIEAVGRGLISILCGTAVMAVVATTMWNAGRRAYSGTGA